MGLRDKLKKLTSSTESSDSSYNSSSYGQNQNSSGAGPSYQPQDVSQDFSKLRINDDSKSSFDHEYKAKGGPSPGPPPGHDYSFQGGPPPGPPPGHNYMASAGPPPGPPPSHFSNNTQNFFESAQHPSGPPPNHTSSTGDMDALPSYSLISADQQSRLPTYGEPSQLSQLGYKYSQAPDDERDMGQFFSKIFPIYPPLVISGEQYEQMSTHRLKLVAPPRVPEYEFPKPLRHSTRFKGGDIKYVSAYGNEAQDHTFIQTKNGTKDIYFVSNWPLYSHDLAERKLFPLMYSSASSPDPTPSIMYFETLITSIGNPEENIVAVGFTCLPYPEYRQPGWHRGSLAVHSDDGHRYVNDSEDGIDFTTSFGDTGTVVGIGMDMKRMAVFFTRNGKWEREWSLIEDLNNRSTRPEREFTQGGIEGLQGDKDIYAVVGVFGKVGVQVNLNGPFRYKGIKRP